MQRCFAWAGGLVLGIMLMLGGQPAQAVIETLTPLKNILAESHYIFTVTVDTLDPDKPSVVFLVDEDLKEKAPFRRLPVNLKGDREAEKEKHTPQLLKRLAPKLPLVVFVNQSGKRYIAFAYTNGTWFQMIGQKTDDADTVRWSFTHCEPYLRRTYKGTTAELKQVVADCLADKKKPPEPNSKEPPGFGPEVEKNELQSHRDTEKKEPRTENREPRTENGKAVTLLSFSVPQSFFSSLCLCVSVVPFDPVFAVIPTVLIGGPLAILSVLFPAVFGGVTGQIRRWLALLSTTGLTSIVYMLYDWDWSYQFIKGTWWGSPMALWLLMTLITLAGTVWAWHRHLKAVQAGQPLAANSGRGEQIMLGIMSAAGLGMVVFCLLKRQPLVSAPWSLLFVLCIGIWGATLYVLYGRLSARWGPSVRASLPVEGIALVAMVVASLGLSATLPRGSLGGEVKTGDAGTALEEAERTVTTGQVVWNFELPEAGVVVSSPLVAGERIYVAAAHYNTFDPRGYGTLYCLDRNTRKPVPGFNCDEPMKKIFSAPCLAEGRIYIGEGFHEDPDCKLYCFDADTGKKLWEFQTRSHTESTPRVVNGRVFFGAGDEGVYCLNAVTGEEIWHFPGLHVDVNLEVVGNRVYGGSCEGDIYKDFEIFCLDADTGKPIWRKPTDLPVPAAPKVADGQVFFGLGNGKVNLAALTPAGALLCVEAQTGQTLWRYDMDETVLGMPMVDQRSVYFGGAGESRGHFYCVSRKEGRLRWERSMNKPVYAAPALVRCSCCGATTSVYVLASDGQVSCLDPASGQDYWTLHLSDEFKRLCQLISSPTVIPQPEEDGEGRWLFFGTGLSPNGTNWSPSLCWIRDKMRARH